jgi:hypothetical protein
MLALHLHDDPVQNAVADYRQPRQLSRTVLEKGRARIGRQRMTGGKQRRHLLVGKTDGRHGETAPRLARGESRAMVVLFSREECLSAAPGARRVRGRLYLPTNPQRQALPRAPARPHQRRHPRSTQAQSDRGGFVVVVKVAATNKCLARSNKSSGRDNATKKRNCQ